jgi:cell division septation protein DedD
VRRLAVAAASLLLAQAALGDSFTVRIQETAIVEIAGATAAYTTSTDIADVAIAGPGRLSVTGRSEGTTQLVVITANGTQSYLIRVAAAARPAATRPEPGVPITRYEGRYSSGARQFQSTVGVVKETGNAEGRKRTELHLLQIHELRPGRDRPADSIASIYYRVTTPRRELTLLDAMVDVSRITISNTQVRGLHLRQGPLELHAGYASSTMYDSFFLTAERRWVGGAGYGFDAGSNRLTPAIYAFFSEPEGTAARRGLVGAFTAEHRVGDTLYVRGDVGVSRSVAAAGELRTSSARQQFRAQLSFKPDDFPTLGLSALAGGHAELDWSRRIGDRLSIVTYGTYDRLRLATLRQTIGTGSTGLQYAMTPRLSLLGGADMSVVRTPTTSIRTIGLPLGVAYEAPAFGAAASYRLLDNSSASRRGDALRLNAHTAHGGFSASAWAERQRNAPTLDLIFSAQPGLELALLRLGITVRTPEDVARALRDNAALIDLGFITGVNVDLTPRRLQAGVNLAWLGTGPRSNHLRLLAIFGRDEGIRTTRDSLIATLTYSRRFLAATDLYGSYSWWRAGLITQQETGTSLEIGVRQQLNGLPAFLQRSGTIEGFVFLDPEMRGVRGPGTQPLPDITVTLDDGRSARTDGRGVYAFRNVKPGPHRIAAQLPAAPRAFFTTSSSAEAKVPAHVDFGLVWAAARIDGRVISDAGAGIPGVVLSAAPRNGPPISTTSDSRGGFVFAVPPGTFRVGLGAESLPAGYSVAGEAERTLTAETDRPQTVSFEAHALRSVSGKALGASEVQIESLGRTARVDATGNFVFRSMPAGTFTLTARSGGRAVSRSVTLPDEPVLMRDVVLEPLAASAANTNATPDRSAGGQPAPVVAAGTATPRFTPAGVSPRPPSRAASVRDDRAFRVQVGAFRLPENAVAARQRMQRRGVQAEIIRSGPLHLVSVGPFASREAAEAEEARLEATGIDAVLMTARGLGRTSEAPSVSAPSLSSRSSFTTGPHIVQAGAFRDPQHAAELMTRLQHSGEAPFTANARGLILVYLGPFESRPAALAAIERLRREGFDGFVTRR